MAEGPVHDSRPSAHSYRVGIAFGMVPKGGGARLLVHLCGGAPFCPGLGVQAGFS